jgi:hypothetical protein
VHPEHGEDVVYVRGQALPSWVVEALDAGRFDRGESGLTLRSETTRSRRRRQPENGRNMVAIGKHLRHDRP